MQHRRFDGGSYHCVANGSSNIWLLPDGRRSSESSCSHARTAIVLLNASLLELLVWNWLIHTAKFAELMRLAEDSCTLHCDTSDPRGGVAPA